jgi:hypothetical protein
VTVAGIAPGLPACTMFHCVHESIDGCVSVRSQRETGRAVGKGNRAPNDKIIGEIMRRRRNDVIDGICGEQTEGLTTRGNDKDGKISESRCDI